MKKFMICILWILILTRIIYAAPAKTNIQPLPVLRCDESIKTRDIIPYLGSRQSPGDQIGITWYELQTDGSYGQRIDVDDLGQAHVIWMFMDAAVVNRYIAWNLRYSNGLYYGETQASPSWSGYAHLDIMRDLTSSNQRTVIAYHYNPGSGYYSWIDIDTANAGGAWPNTPRSPFVADHIWPYMAVANNNNLILATGDYGGSIHHLYVSTNEGISWSYITGYDSCALLSLFVRASEKRDTNKVAFVHTRYKTDSVAAGQLDNDVWYSFSDDGGINWGPHINLTNYQPDDTVRAYCNVNAIFDDNDHLHIAWPGRKVDSAGYYEASKIFHWDEYNDTVTVINSPSTYYNEPGGWWITIMEAGDPGAYRLPADQPQLIFDTTTSCLYCLWHGNDDYNDYSAAGYFNGEFYGAYSTDYGITWSDYVNLTNTRTPGAGAGACHDEDYMTACPKVVNDSILITYVEDKDAGAYPHTEGVMTENPVRCWVFPTSLITGIQENKSEIFDSDKMSVYPNPFVKSMNIDFSIGLGAKGIELKIYDATGRLVKSITQLHNYSITWSGDDQGGCKLPAGIYFVELSSGKTKITKKVIKLK